MAELFGVDVSHWQSAVDWRKAKSAGVQFGIVKACDWWMDGSKGFVDSQFKANMDGMGDAGVLSGMYCWLQPLPDPKRQADYFLENCWRKYPKTNITPVVDFEDVNATNYTDYLWRLQVWLETVEFAVGRIPMVYTAKWFMQPRYGTSSKVSFLAKYPLWVAWYSVWPLQLPYPWTDHAIHQFGVRKGTAGELGASSKDIDVDKSTTERMAAITTVTVPVEITDAEKLARLWSAHPEIH